MAQPSSPLKRLSFTFQKFTFGDDTNRQRPIKIAGILAPYVTAPAAPALAHYTGGDTASAYDAMNGFDKGHVILASYSGVSNPENIVPMYPCFNQAGGLWRDLETRLAAYTKVSRIKVTDAYQVHMTVDMEYNGMDGRFPTAFLVTVTDGSMNGAYVYFKQQKLDRLRIPHLPTAAASINPVAEIGGQQVQLLMEAAKEVALSGWTIEKSYPNANVVPLAVIPKRPYAMLDYLWLVKQDVWVCSFLTDGCRYRDGFAAQFHERQKQLIRIVNAMYNKNEIKSDYPGDTTESLIIGSGQRAAQIDHVFPYAGIQGRGGTKYGGNLFSNALIASGAYNNSMKNTDPETKWKDRSGATLYSTTQHN